MASLTTSLTISSTDMSNQESLSIAASKALTAVGKVTAFQKATSTTTSIFANADAYTKSYVFLHNLSGSNVNADATCTVDSTTGIIAGMGISGTNVPAGATVASVTNSTTFELSGNATGDVTNTTFTFTRSVMSLAAGEYAFFPWSGQMSLAVRAAAGTDALEIRIFEVAH
jgi:uncharacterized protein GlcG (DUF336 family)